MTTTNNIASNPRRLSRAERALWAAFLRRPAPSA
jgi:hypothetical protein